MNLERASILFCFCGPSASGKSTISRRLVGHVADLFLSVSTTTRSARHEELEGRDYYFVTEEEFDRRIAIGSFLEHATFNGKRYGTEFRNIEMSETHRIDLLLDIDVQGARALKTKYGARVVVVFVYPPSGEVLLQRLRARGSDNESGIAERLRIAHGEVQQLRDPLLSDYFIANDDLAQAVDQAGAIVTAERLKLSRISPAALENILKVPPV